MVTAMYLRKSRAEENDTVDVTLARHRGELERFAAANGLTVAAVYEEVASGDSLYLRPQMLRLLDELGKYEAVLCMDIDRLGRGAMRDQGIIFEAIRDAGVLIVTPGKTYDMANDMDDSLIGFKALFAREEYKMIRGRLRRGVAKSVEEGCYMSNAPFGYRQVRVDKKPTLAIDAHEADGVRLLFDLYNEGKGCQIVADTLHAAGYRPRRGDKFSRSTIAKIIRNPVYIGKVVWNQYTFTRPKRPGQKHIKRLKPREEWLVTDGLHEAIVSQEVFDEANRRLLGRYHPPYRQAGHLENPLAGVLYCANCGRSMVRQPHYKKLHASPILLCTTSGCCMASSMAAVEDIFHSLLRQSLSDMTSTGYEVRKTFNRAGLQKKFQDELTRLGSQLEKIHELLEQGVYDVDTFLARRDEMKARMGAVRQELSGVSDEPDTETVVKRLRDVLEKYEEGSAYERNQLIKSVVERAVYRKPKGSRLNSLPELDVVRWRA
ncbi:MAG: recombinase family protein [Oscillospiraceae bacterium]|nr:recombinase family protein [Oscillospiraceae bacterium]